MLNPGDTIGDWQIVLPLGRGGMGAVYRCRHALSHRIEAAVKVLEPTTVSGARERFIREAEALHQLRHPAIVRITGFGQDARTGLLFLAMELVQGEDFDKLLSRGAFPRDRAAEIFAALADGLAYAHSRGVAHRDLKPANLMLQADGSPVLLDFGIAVQEGRDRLTQEGVVPGTVAYAAPEQVLAAGRTDPAIADVYALGQVFQECLTGRFVFDRGAEIDDHRRSVKILRAKMKMAPLDPGPAFAPRIRDLVRTATAPEPTRRGPPLAAWSGVLRRGGLLASDANDDVDLPEESATALLAAPVAAPPRSPALPLDLAMPTGEESPLDPLSLESETLPDESRTGTGVRRRRAVGLAAVSAAAVIAVGALSLIAVVAVGVAAWFASSSEQAAAFLIEEPAPPTEDFRLGDVLEADPVDVAEIEAEAARREVRPAVVAPVGGGGSRPRAAAPAGEGRLVVAADTAAAVWVDGSYVRESPTVLRLPAGRYEVELRGPDGASRRFTAAVRPDESVRRIWSFKLGEWRSFEGGVDPAGLPARPATGDVGVRLEGMSATRACLDAHPVEGAVTFTLVVVPDGSVVADGLTGALRGTPLDTCLKEVARTLTFKPSVSGAAVTVTLGR